MTDVEAERVKRAKHWARTEGQNFRSETMIAQMKPEKVISQIRKLKHQRPKNISVRQYAGAEQTELLADFTGQESSLNTDIYHGWRRLYYRAKALSQNNPYAAQFLNIMANNVIGPHGMKLKMKIKNPDGSLDIYANEQIEEGWEEFGKADFFTTSGRVDRHLFERTAIRSLVRDGEVIIRKFKGFQHNAHKFSVMLLSPDLLDFEYMDNLQSGNYVRMGVEYDHWRRPVAYHFRTQSRGDVYLRPETRRNERERVPADQIIHAFMPEAPDQWRGVTWFHAAIKQLHHLASFNEAAIVAARLGASKMGFLTSQADEDAGDDGGEERDSAGRMIQEAEPGMIEELDPGQSFQSWDPQFPSTDPSAFVKSMLKGVSSALGVSYPSLAKDLEGVNYSSIRAGLLEERDHAKMIQHFFADQIMVSIFKDWLEMWLLTERSGNLPVSKLEKFNKPFFQGRRWDWVDPMKDAQAEVLQINNGLKSYTESAAERGRDFADVAEQLKQDQAILQDKGVVLAGKDSPAKKQTPQEEED